mmetsp:Transcript_1809/g.3982  ORF Transcript_1809/g.3982 Transcript_1809/m.3982 type:complete len:224 (-) Transcript_1809:677-1348(-)
MHNFSGRADKDTSSTLFVTPPTTCISTAVGISHAAVTTASAVFVVSHVYLSACPSVCTKAILLSLTPRTYIFPSIVIHVCSFAVVPSLFEFTGIPCTGLPLQLASSGYGIVLPFSIVCLFLPNLNTVAVTLPEAELPAILGNTVGFCQTAKAVFETLFILSAIHFPISPSVHTSTGLFPSVSVTVVSGSIRPLKEATSRQVTLRPMAGNCFTIRPCVCAPSTA